MTKNAIFYSVLYLLNIVFVSHRTFVDLLINMLNALFFGHQGQALKLDLNKGGYICGEMRKIIQRPNQNGNSQHSRTNLELV